MRKILLSIFVMASLFGITCSKDRAGDLQSIYGKWKLVAIAYHGSAGRFGTYTGQPAYVQFNSDGTVTGSARIIDTTRYKTFIIVNDSTLSYPHVQGLGNAQNNFWIKGRMLHMSSGCGFEPCMLKLRKVF